MLKRFNNFIKENLDEQEGIIKDYFYDLIDDGINYTYKFLYDGMFYTTLSYSSKYNSIRSIDDKWFDNNSIELIKKIINQYNNIEDEKITYWIPEFTTVIYIFSQSLIDKLKPIFSNLKVKKRFLDKNIYFYKPIENTENKNRNKKLFSGNQNIQYSNIITQSNNDDYLYLDQSIWDKVNKILPYHTQPYISAEISDAAIQCVMYDIYKIECSTPSIFSRCRNSKILNYHKSTFISRGDGF